MFKLTMFTKVFILLILTISLIFLAIQFINADVEAVRAGYTPSIVVYTAMSKEVTEEYVKKFENEKGIKVNLLHYSNQTLINKLIAEADAPQADVIWGVAFSSVIDLDHRGMLRPYGNIAEDDVQKFENSDKNWVGIKPWSPAICVNTALLNQLNLAEPKSWEDLMKPEYEDLIVMPSPTTAATGLLIISSILHHPKNATGDNDQPISIDDNWEHLRQFDKNIALYTRKLRTICEMVEDNKYPIGISTKNNRTNSYYLEDDVAWDIDTVALINKNVNNPNTQAFFEWVVTEEARDLYKKNTYNSDQKMEDTILPWLAARQVSIVTKWEKEEMFLSKVEKNNEETSTIRKVIDWFTK